MEGFPKVVTFEQRMKMKWMKTWSRVHIHRKKIPSRGKSNKSILRLGILGTRDGQQGGVLLVGRKLEDEWLNWWQELYPCGTMEAFENLEDFVLCVMGHFWRIVSKRVMGSDLCIKSTLLDDLPWCLSRWLCSSHIGLLSIE